MPHNWSPVVDANLRQSALDWLARRTNDGADLISSEDLRDFRFRGEPLPPMDLQRGIRKPAVPQAALLFRTVYRPDPTRPDGAARPYEDSVGSDGRFRYKYRGTDAEHAENRELRAAMVHQLPLIWFFGMGAGIYVPTFPFT